MALKCSSEDLAYSFYDLHKVESALATMRKFGISPLDESFLHLYDIRGKILGTLGLKTPKPMPLIIKLVGLSPGEIKVFFDPEGGWLVDARVKPGAPPVYHLVSDEVAMAILKKEVTHELEAELMTPDVYLGE